MSKNNVPKQQWKDSEGNFPNLPPGTPVLVPCMGDDFRGVVVHQRLHYDCSCSETSFGDVCVEGNDNEYYRFKCWQCKRIHE